MNLKEVNEKLRINGPKYYGGPTPEWREDMVNEETFYPGGRLKTWFLKDDKMVFVTQEVASYMNIVNFKKELRRWLNYIGYTDKLPVVIYDRSGIGDDIEEEI